MAEAIREISVARGYDVRDYALVVFGGAGGQHACGVARRLGIETVVFHPLAGVLSAYGIGLSDVTFHGEREVRGARVRPSTAPDLGRSSPSSRPRPAPDRGRTRRRRTSRGPASRPPLRRNGDRTHAARRERRGARDPVRPRAAARIRTRSPSSHPIEPPAARVEVGRHRELPRHASRRARKARSERPSSTRGCSSATAGSSRYRFTNAVRFPRAPRSPDPRWSPTRRLNRDRAGFGLVTEPNGLLVLRAGEAAAALAEPSEAGASRPRDARDR